MADFTDREFPYMGAKQPEVRKRMREHRSKRAMITKAYAAARRAKNFKEMDYWDKRGEEEGVQVGGIDQTKRIRQQVLADMAFDKDHALEIDHNRRMRKLRRLAGLPEDPAPAAAPAAAPAPAVEEGDDPESVQEEHVGEEYSEGFFEDVDVDEDEDEDEVASAFDILNRRRYLS